MIGSKFLGLAKPEYICQPTRLLRRLVARKTESEFMDIILPWDLRIRVRPNEALGRALRCLGVYDLAVTETAWRLLDTGETAVDIGANMGYMTAVMAGRLMQGGEILSFEPHPQTFQELIYNVARWQQLLPRIRFLCYQAALSDKPGKLILMEPPGFEDNRGSAKVGSHEPKEEGTFFEVPATRLDNALEGIDDIHLLKLDVEGHEWHVLRGGPRLLGDHRVRDVIFEEHNPYPTAASDLLEACGYNVYRIRKTFWGPHLLPPDATVPRSSWEPTSFLATHAPDRAKQRLSARGWFALRSGV